MEKMENYLYSLNGISEIENLMKYSFSKLIDITDLR